MSTPERIVVCSSDLLERIARQLRVTTPEAAHAIVSELVLASISGTVSDGERYDRVHRVDRVGYPDGVVVAREPSLEGLAPYFAIALRTRIESGEPDGIEVVDARPAWALPTPWPNPETGPANLGKKEVDRLAARLVALAFQQSWGPVELGQVRLRVDVRADVRPSGYVLRVTVLPPLVPWALRLVIDPFTGARAQITEAERRPTSSLSRPVESILSTRGVLAYGLERDRGRPVPDAACVALGGRDTVKRMGGAVEFRMTIWNEDQLVRVSPDGSITGVG